MMAFGMVVIAADRRGRGPGARCSTGSSSWTSGVALNGGDRDRRARDRARPCHDGVEHAGPADAEARLGGRRAGDPADGRSWCSRSLATLVAVLVGREVLVQQDFPRARRIDVGRDPRTRSSSGPRPTSAAHLGHQGLPDPVLLGPDREPAARGPVVDGRRGRSRSPRGGSRAGGSRVHGVRLLPRHRPAREWDDAMDTLSLVLVTVAIALVFAIPLGILAAPERRFERALRPVLDAMQVMPAFVYLVPVVRLFAPGRVPGVIASVIYAVPVGHPAHEPRRSGRCRRRPSRRARRSVRARCRC